ncbi:MAG: hypothetical protein GX610_07660 [Rhodococcus sp.]|nr:hypothetical protein [Rhodococcus sp. (in: high G+C Gram-positive bacteria)]
MDATRHFNLRRHHALVIQPTFPSRRHNSPSADSICSDLARLTQLPIALFVADEAGITVTIDGGQPTPVRALISVGPYGERDNRVHLIAQVPDLGVVESTPVVPLSKTVEDVIPHCVIAFASAVADASIDAKKHAELSPKPGLRGRRHRAHNPLTRNSDRYTGYVIATGGRPGSGLHRTPPVPAAKTRSSPPSPPDTRWQACR